MHKSLLIGSLSVMAVAGAFVLAPLAVNAQETATQNRVGYGVRDGSGEGRQGNGNGQATSLENRAKALDMTVEQLQEKLETQTMLQIAQEKGISTEDFQAKMREASAARWQDRGVSAEQVQERAAAQAERQADCDGTGEHRAEGGFGRNQKTQ